MSHPAPPSPPTAWKRAGWAAVLLLLLGVAQASPPDLAQLIRCEGTVQDMQALQEPATDSVAAVSHGWIPLPRRNPFLDEFRLVSPLQIHGYTADRFLIAGGTVMAILSGRSADAAQLAFRLALEVAVDAPDKFMAGREIYSLDRQAPDNDTAWIESAVLGISTIQSHPDDLLLGCTYSIDLPDEPKANPALTDTPVAATAS